jgi:hypothetical protein
MEKKKRTILVPPQKVTVHQADFLLFGNFFVFSFSEFYQIRGFLKNKKWENRRKRLVSIKKFRVYENDRKSKRNCKMKKGEKEPNRRKSWSLLRCFAALSTTRKF